jgi:tRNA pseudouridine55 synthase
MLSEEISYFDSGQVLLFDKPYGWTSFDLVNKVRIMIRSIMGQGKVKTGHAGTLDPLATGLLIICTGKATRKISEFMDLEKEYLATLRLGVSTPSYDLETETDKEYPTVHISKELVLETLKEFKGEQLQVPPLFSAKFIEGKRAYEYARKGKDIKLEPKLINIREAELIDYQFPEITLRLLCSKGTYVRSFARDFGEALGSGACLAALRRTKIGPYKVEDSYSLEKFEFFLKQLKQS